jgi:hypothetical protein
VVCYDSEKRPRTRLAQDCAATEGPYLVMTDPAVTDKQLVDLARKNIKDQQDRIARQRKLLGKYERDDDVGRLSGARLVLNGCRSSLLK